MKVRMFATAAGPAGVMHRGKVYALPAERAKDLIESGYAERADADEPVVEVATAAEAESPKKPVRKKKKTTATKK